MMGQSNISAYSHGMMGYKTPNIDRIEESGVEVSPVGSDANQLWAAAYDRSCAGFSDLGKCPS